MGICSRRYFFLSICLLQMITVVERQVFDFLGFLWIPILINFFEIIFIIFGFFGAYQYRPKYIIAYLLWHLFWIGWNVFMICLYLNIAGLDHKKNKVLKLDLNSDSWWKKGGPGCKVKDINAIPVEYEGCLINYVHVEIVQAGIQCFFAVLNSIMGVCVSRTFLEEDDTSPCKNKNKAAKPRPSLYSIEFSSPIEHRHDDSDNDFEVPTPVSPKPMTPRRVKRRSVMTRGSSGRHSTSSRRSHARSSTRSRKMAQNPVTRIIEQQQKKSYDSPSSLSPIESPLPTYYNYPNNNMIGNQHWGVHHPGHINPNYQQSSQQSLNDTEELDDLYNNRPASVRSSYSNFHGTRTLNYSSKHFNSNATPQVPQKRPTTGRNSMRSVTFLNNGPPAYTSHGLHPPDSETPM